MENERVNERNRIGICELNKDQPQIQDSNQFTNFLANVLFEKIGIHAFFLIVLHTGFDRMMIYQQNWSVLSYGFRITCSLLRNDFRCEIELSTSELAEYSKTLSWMLLVCRRLISWRYGHYFDYRFIDWLSIYWLIDYRLIIQNPQQPFLDEREYTRDRERDGRRGRNQGLSSRAGETRYGSQHSGLL